MQREPFFPNVARSELAIWAGAAAMLLLVLHLKLLSAMLAGLLVYELVRALTDLLRLSSMGHHNARVVAVALLTTAVVTLLTLAILGLASVLRHGSDSLPALLQKLAEILDNSRKALPDSLNDYLPADADTLRNSLTAWLRHHSGEVGGAGLLAGRAFAHILIGMVIGAMLSLHDPGAQAQRRPLAAAIADHASRLSTAFRRVVFAQAWIATINAAITAVYLVLALPLFGVHMPLVKTLLALTFVAGLIPILGNLVSNAAIVMVSFGVSLPVAVASLVFLIAVHKLQYFLNARIIGSQIRAAAWELLLAMVVMEAAFGVAGVVAAPIYYAYFKDELTRKGPI